jgi:hypothetical protein
MEGAIERHDKRQLYAALAQSLYLEYDAATRLQAAWRACAERRRYLDFKRTAEFAARQAEYEAQEKARTPASSPLYDCRSYMCALFSSLRAAL